jgi:glutamate-ammonia-ligase adenylyltransferase
MAIVGMGKLGGREMTATSDLDLIFVYADVGPGTLSDGKRPLPASQYYARLSQRLINALTAPTGEGKLYEVDMRLRPSGKAGPIAVSVGSFARYQHDHAWVWEQMALTRARVIAGPPALAAEIEQIIRAVLTRSRDPKALVAEVAAMRARMAEEHRTQSLWDVKHIRGGLVDIEFIAQYLQLKHAQRFPHLLSQNTREALLRLQKAQLIDHDSGRLLVEALALLQAVQHRIRLNIGEAIGAIGGSDAPKALRLAVAGLAGLDFEGVVVKVEAAVSFVYDYFRSLVETPAEEACAVFAGERQGDG